MDKEPPGRGVESGGNQEGAEKRPELEVVELGVEQKDIEPEQVQKLRKAIEFLRLTTGEVFDWDKTLQILPDINPDKLETLYNLAELAEQKYELREQLRVFSEIFDLSVEEMRDVIDTTSAWTEDHTTRVSILGYRLASRMWPFDTEFKKSLWQAGLLHDVGKVATPKSILDKDGRPTPDEREVLNLHPEDGDRLLSNLVRHDPFIADGTKHHEKWGGGGYSYDLRGNEIPFISQVLSVADVYDALSSERPYKQGFSPGKCMRTIEEMSQRRQLFDDQGELVLDTKTGDPVIIPEHFSKLPVAYLKTMYENRELSTHRYFDVEREEAKIDRELEVASPYSKKENKAASDKDRHEAAMMISGTLKEFKLVAPEDLKRYIDRADLAAMETRLDVWSREVQKLEAERDKSQEVFVDALFLLIKSVDARYRAYHEGSDMDRLAGGQERTENVIRYSLMLAQQMGMSVEEQKKVAMAAMFCDFGVLGIDETKVRSEKTLGVTSFEELKQVPTIGYNLLQKFTGDPEYPEVAKYFDGAEIGAAEAHLWADGKGGYGVKLNPDGKPSDMGKIVAIAYKYVAMRADNPYRGKGLDHNRAMEIMRRGVGAEFDENIWEHWEVLYARDTLRVFKERPEVISYIKDLFKGQERLIIFSGSERDKVVEYAQAISATRDKREKMKLCFEAAEYASKIGFFSGMERFFELAEPIALKLKYERIVSLMERLYDYDLEQAEKQELETMRRRLQAGKVISAIGVVESLVIDFAERGQSITPKLAEQIRGEIIPVYKDFVLRKVRDYRFHTLSLDKDALSGDIELLDRGLQEIGDDSFSAEVRREMEKIRQSGTIQEVNQYSKLIEEFTDEKNDSFNGEHLVAKAEKVFQELTPKNQRLLIVKFESARRSLYRRGYSVAFEQLQGEAEEGNVHIVLELEKRVQHWMGEAREEGISEKEFTEQKQVAYRQGIDKMRSMLQADSLGLEDIPRVGRWIANINEWQKEADIPSAERMDKKKLRSLEHHALKSIRDNMLAEIDELIEQNDQAMLRRLVVMVSDYIVEPNNIVLRTHELDGRMTVVRNKLFDLFTQDIKRSAQAGEAEKVSSAIHYFHKFCGGDGRGEIVGLTENQREILQDTKREAYHYSLMLRVDNIGRFGAEARISQLEREIERLQEDRTILENMGEKIDADVLASRINEAVYKSLVSKVTASIQSGSVKTLSLAIEKLHKLIDDGFVERDEEILESIREVTVPFIREHLPELAERGSLQEFELLENTLRNISGAEFKELADEIAASKHTCYKNYAKRVAIQLKIYGVKSYIGLMRQEEDRLLELKQKAPELVDDSIFEYSQREAERIVRIARLKLSSYGLLHSIASGSTRAAVRHIKGLVDGLLRTQSGLEDARSLGHLAVES